MTTEQLEQWEAIRRNRKTRRIKLAHVVSYDSTHRDSSLVRELEMLVDSATDQLPGFTIQFFQDARVYNLVEAVIYLENTLYSKGFYAEKVGAVRDLREKIGQIIGKFDLNAI